MKNIRGAMRIISLSDYYKRSGTIWDNIAFVAYAVQAAGGDRVFMDC